MPTAPREGSDRVLQDSPSIFRKKARWDRDIRSTPPSFTQEYKRPLVEEQGAVCKHRGAPGGHHSVTTGYTWDRSNFPGTKFQQPKSKDDEQKPPLSHRVCRRCQVCGRARCGAPGEGSSAPEPGTMQELPVRCGLWGPTGLESRAWEPTKTVGLAWGGHREGRALLKSSHQAMELAPAPPALAPLGSLGTAVQQPKEHLGTCDSNAQGRAGQAPPLHQSSPDPSGCRPQLLSGSGGETGRGGTGESKPERNEEWEDVKARAGLAVEPGEGARAARTLPAARG